MKIKFLILTLCFSTLIACGGGSSSDSETNSLNACAELEGAEKDFNKLIGGDNCVIDSSTPIVRVAAQFVGSQGRVALPICSGAMITRSSVLTAAHCTLDPQLPGLTIEGYGIITGSAGNLKYYPARQIAIAPGFSESLNGNTTRIFNDLAVMTLVENLSINVLPILSSRAAQSGEAALVYGYGIESSKVENSSLDFLNLKGASMQVREVTPNHIFVRFSGSGANVCFGDSGGPILVETEVGFAIAGVVSQGSNSDCTKGDVTTYTNIAQSNLSAWLQTVVTADLQY